MVFPLRDNISIKTMLKTMTDQLAVSHRSMSPQIKINRPNNSEILKDVHLFKNASFFPLMTGLQDCYFLFNLYIFY